MTIRLIAAAVLPCVLLLVHRPAWAQQLELTLESEKARYLRAEPVVVHLTITNGGEARTIPAALEPEYDAVRYVITRPSGAAALFRPWSIAENSAGRQLAPGESLSVPARLFFGATGWTFRGDGTYEIAATFAGVRSNPIRIEIVEPSGAAREHAEMLLASEEAGRFLLLDGGDHLEGGIAILTRVASGETALAGYAANALGQSQSRRFANLRTGAIRPPDPLAAGRLLERSWRLLPADAAYFRRQNLLRLEPLLESQGRRNDWMNMRQEYRIQIDGTALSAPLRQRMQQALRR